MCKKIDEKIKELVKKALQNKKQFGGAVAVLLLAVILLVTILPTSKKTATVELPIVSTENSTEPEESSTIAEEVVEEAVENEKQPVEEFSDEKKSEEVTEEVISTEDVISIEPKNVVLTFDAQLTKDIEFQIYYTENPDAWYDDGHSVMYQGKAGEEKYSIVLPTDKIYLIRIDFGENPEDVTIKDIYLTGSQKADLNDFTNCEFHEMENIKKNEDGSLSFSSTTDDPYLAYEQQLIK